VALARGPPPAPGGASGGDHPGPQANDHPHTQPKRVFSVGRSPAPQSPPSYPSPIARLPTPAWARRSPQHHHALVTDCSPHHPPSAVAPDEAPTLAAWSRGLVRAAGCSPATGVHPGVSRGAFGTRSCLAPGTLRAPESTTGSVAPGGHPCGGSPRCPAHLSRGEAPPRLPSRSGPKTSGRCPEPRSRRGAEAAHWPTPGH
jgi:hypothetical protein